MAVVSAGVLVEIFENAVLSVGKSIFGSPTLVGTRFNSSGPEKLDQVCEVIEAVEAALKVSKVRLVDSAGSGHRLMPLAPTSLVVRIYRPDLENPGAVK